jgi:hypothetical protein
VFDEQDSIQDDQDVHTSLILKRIKRNRYLFRKPTYRKHCNRFDLEDWLSVMTEKESHTTIQAGLDPHTTIMCGGILDCSRREKSISVTWNAS